MPHILIFFLLLVIRSNKPSYYSEIHEAESHVINFNYEKAFDKYDRIFSQGTIYYIKDAHNAFICARKLGDDEKIERAVDYLKRFHLDEKYIARYPELKYSSHNALDSTLVSHREDVSDFLDSLFHDDQQPRVDCKKYHKNYNAACKEKFIVVDSINLKRFEEFVNVNTFPNESHLSECIPGNLPKFYVILLHNSGLRGIYLREILHTQVLGYNFHPQLLADLDEACLDTMKRKTYGLGNAIILNGNLYTFPLEEDNPGLVEINSKRDKIMLEDLNTYLKKVEFQFFHPEFRLIYGFLIKDFKAGAEMTQVLSTKWADCKVEEYQPPD